MKYAIALSFLLTACPDNRQHDPLVDVDGPTYVEPTDHRPRGMTAEETGSKIDWGPEHPCDTAQEEIEHLKQINAELTDALTRVEAILKQFENESGVKK